MKRKTIIIIMSMGALFGFYYLLINNLHLIKSMNRPVPDVDIPTSLQAQIDSITCSSVDDIIKYSTSLTSDYLSYRKGNDIRNGHANCVGYAQLCSQIANQLIGHSGLSGKAKPVVGYISLGRINCCDVAQRLAPKKWKNFVKDHDFVELACDGIITYYDPCAYDLIGNNILSH